MALDDFVRGYIEAALFSSTDNSDPSGGEPLDANFGPDDIDEATLAQMRADCEAFLHLVESFARETGGGKPLAEIQSAVEIAGFDPLEPDAMLVAGDYLQERGFAEEDIDAYAIRAPLLRLIEDGDLETEIAGANFWFSRNGHGTGFFDRDEYRGEEGTLQDMAETFGDYNLIVNVNPPADENELYDELSEVDGQWFLGFDGPFNNREEAEGEWVRRGIDNGNATLTGM